MLDSITAKNSWILRRKNMSQAKQFLESQMSKRSILADQVPMEKPFSIQICCSTICNLQCEFCAVSLPQYKEFFHNLSSDGFIDYGLLRKIVDDIKDSFGSVKQIILTGNGEPLLNPRIADIVGYITSQKVAKQTILLTNGVALTPDLSNRLIEAGLSTLRVSVNGLSGDDYFRHCHSKIDFDNYVEQLRYFYTHKKQTSVYIKIINYMVPTPEMRAQFFQTFERICDVINVENLYTSNNGIDYQEVAQDPSALEKCKYAEKKIQSSICSIPFYQLEIREDGSAVPCSEALICEDSRILGNLREMSIHDIWAKESFLFQKRMLGGAKNIPMCRDCIYMLNHIYPEDVLDGYAEHLKKVYDSVFDKS